ncbi:hypothetical protein SKA53_08746 [Yoonia vestfoldensis SKA53]|uniref:Uncharacterized protein n=1 Tax=Yoonia vestfoldensis SKA53 TaxID=314232 RepID=A3V7G5_9RHOB|nr:hypothetical protein SKA53_08746 [Yoonia vestfoldensis SKA53]
MRSLMWINPSFDMDQCITPRHTAWIGEGPVRANDRSLTRLMTGKGQTDGI